MIRSSRVIPALLTRMSTLPNASRTALTSASAPSCSFASAWTARARRPSASTSATRRLGGGLVAAVAERDVGALAWRAAARSPCRCRASRPSRGRSCRSGRSCVGSLLGIGRAPALTTLSVPAGGALRLARARRRTGRARPGSGRARISARAGGIGSTESQSTGSRTPHVLGTDGVVGAAAGGRVRRPLHRHGAGREPGPERHEHDLVARPATRPSLTASARAIGTDAAEVLPYLSRLTYSRSIGRSRPFATASMIRTLAWCGMIRSTSSWLPAGLRRPRRAPSRRASGSRTGTSPCPPSGSCARRGRWSPRDGGLFDPPAGSQIM